MVLHAGKTKKPGTNTELSLTIQLFGFPLFPEPGLYENTVSCAGESTGASPRFLGGKRISQRVPTARAFVGGASYGEESG